MRPRLRASLSTSSNGGTKMKRIKTVLIFAMMIAVGCVPALTAARPADAPGAVYTMTNTVPNAVVVYSRSADGSLTPEGQVLTGGNGTGIGLGNQGGVVLSQNKRWLFVVNAGSSHVSVFRVLSDGIVLTDVLPSGGTMPLSVTVHGKLVYVLNAGFPNNITGFELNSDGKLIPLPGSARPLSASMTGPAQIEFSPDGDALVVTEKNTNIIDVFPIDRNGIPEQRVGIASHGTTPFGFSFGLRDQILVSEAFGGAANASAVSSYTLNPAGTLTLVTGSAPTMQSAACWVVVTANGR